MTEQKINSVNELSDKLKESEFFYVLDGAGMTVAEVNNFRRACFEKGLSYKVVKNTLFRKALEQTGNDYSAFADKTLKGFSGIVFTDAESGNLPAKVLKEYRKKQGKKKEVKPLLKGASIDSDFFYGDESVETLSNLKSKNELIGDVILLLQSPAKNVISSLNSASGTLAGLLKSLEERAQ